MIGYFHLLMNVQILTITLQANALGERPPLEQWVLLYVLVLFFE